VPGAFSEVISLAGKIYKESPEKIGTENSNILLFQTQTLKFCKKVEYKKFSVNKNLVDNI
jgi:hypothetical protein